jgi:hypothetical protein
MDYGSSHIAQFARELERENAALEARNAEMEGALRALVDQYTVQTVDGYSDVGGHLRRARALLERQGV